MDGDNTAPPAFPLRVLYSFQSENIRLPDGMICMFSTQNDARFRVFYSHLAAFSSVAFEFHRQDAKYR